MALGIDIGSTSIKLISVSRQKGGKHLDAAAVVKAPIKGMVSEAEEDMAAIATEVRRVMTDAKVNTREVVTCLPESEVITKVVSMPKLSDQELASAIEWEAEQFIPMPVAEANISYEVIYRPADSTGQMKVLLVATAKKLVDKYVKVFEMAGLKVVGVETDMIAAARSLVPSGAKTLLVVDMGARSTDMAVVTNGKVVFTRSIATAGEALTRAVSVGLSMEVVQAEEYKKAYGLTDQLEGKVRSVLSPVYEVIAGEMRRALEFYRNSQPGENISTVVLCGGTAGLPGLVPDLAAKLGMEVIVGDPFFGLVKNEALASSLSGYAPLYSIVAGLALSEV